MATRGEIPSVAEMQRDIERLNALLKLTEEKRNSLVAEKPGKDSAVKRKPEPPSLLHFNFKSKPTIGRPAAEFEDAEGTPRYFPPRPSSLDKKRYGHRDTYSDGEGSTTPPGGVPPPATTTTGPPTGNSEWFQFMREEREASDRRMMQMMQTLALGRAPNEGINKAVPQVQPMSKHEDLREFFDLFETTQSARRTPREAYAATLLPLLNATCKSLALSLPADTRTSYSRLKRELLAQADSRADATTQVFGSTVRRSHTLGERS